MDRRRTNAAKICTSEWYGWMDDWVDKLIVSVLLRFNFSVSQKLMRKLSERPTAHELEDRNILRREEEATSMEEKRKMLLRKVAFLLILMASKRKHPFSKFCACKDHLNNELFPVILSTYNPRAEGSTNYTV